MRKAGPGQGRSFYSNALKCGLLLSAVGIKRKLQVGLRLNSITLHLMVDMGGRGRSAGEESHAATGHEVRGGSG